MIVGVHLHVDSGLLWFVFYVRWKKVRIVPKTAVVLLICRIAFPFPFMFSNKLRGAGKRGPMCQNQLGFYRQMIAWDC